MVGCPHSAVFVQGSLSATLPASADVTTRDWLRSGMMVQLLQVHTLPVISASSTSGVSPNESSTSGVSPNESSTRLSEKCMARGVLQPDALLDGVTREWSGRLSLVRALPLFNAKGVRLGLHNGETGADEVCSLAWHVCIVHRCA